MSLRLGPRVLSDVIGDWLAHHQARFRISLNFWLLILDDLELFEAHVPRRAGKGSLHEGGADLEELQEMLELATSPPESSRSRHQEIDL